MNIASPTSLSGALAATLPPLAVLLGALGLLARIRTQALRASHDDPARAWFGFAQQSRGVLLCAWVLWGIAFWALGTSRLVSLWPGPPSPLRDTVFVLTIGLLPPSLLVLAFAALSHSIEVRVRGITWTRREALTQTALQLAAILSAFAGIVIGIGGGLAPAQMIGALVLGIVACVVFTSLHRKALDFTPHALTTGVLRDRVFALAAKAHVTVRQIYLIPMTRGRIANAFAMQGEQVLFTDHLLRHLTRREVDAVVAHELAHLKLGHPRALAILAVLTATGIALAIMYGHPALVAALGSGGVIAGLVMSRRFERAADQGAVDLTGDPEAMISALVRLHHLNHLPLAWGRLSDWLMTHPSLKRRAHGVAAAGGLAPSRVEGLLLEPLAAGDHYVVPIVEGRATRAFSTQFKLESTTRIGWMLVAILVLVPMLFASFAEGLMLGSGTSVVMALAGLLLTLVTALAALNVLAVSMFRPLRARVRERLLEEGINPDRDGGVFVGFAPAGVPRVFENFYDWDVGFLFLRGGRFSFIGEQVRFALTPRNVEGLERIPGAPGWIPTQRIRIEWHDPSGQGGRFLMRPADAGSLVSSLAATRRLHQAIERWRVDARQAALPFEPAAALGPPSYGTVTSVSPRSLAGARQALTGSALLAVVAAVAWVVLGMASPFTIGRLFYTIGVATTVQVFLLIPNWRYRDPRPERTATSSEAAAA